MHAAVVQTLTMSFTGLSEIIEKKKEKTEGRIKKHYMKTQQTGGGDSYRISNTTNQREGWTWVGSMFLRYS
jgi:hypothetical protein